MSEANKELVRRHFEEIFNHKNLVVCDEIMAEDFVEHSCAFRTVCSWQGEWPSGHASNRRMVARTIS